MVLPARIENKRAADVKCKRPLTEREINLYKTLTTALLEKLILPQVAFHRFLYTTGNKKDRWKLFNRFKKKVVGYVSIIAGKGAAPAEVRKAWLSDIDIGIQGRDPVVR